MYESLTLLDIAQEDVTQAREALTDIIKSVPRYANLDLRVGTVLCDLLLRPQAELWALEQKRLEFVQRTHSLQTLMDSGENITDEAINRILANFNLKIRPSGIARGSLIIRVSRSTNYSISEGTIFKDSFDRNFHTTADYTFSPNPTENDLPMYTAEDGSSYFILPVVAEEEGEAYLLKEGDTVTPQISIFKFISASAYADFVGAASVEDIEQIIKQIPASLSHKSLESRKSIEAILTSPDFGNFESIRAVSVAGAGDECQLRDKHNVMGVSVFGRVDVYPRTFERPEVVTLIKEGIQTAPHTYEITIDALDAPGYYSVRSVSDADAIIAPIFTLEPLKTVGSYPIEDVRSFIDLRRTGHDILEANGVVETAYTKYQTGKIIVNNVMTGTDDVRLFKVVLYSAPDIAKIQDYVDSAGVRNIKADYLVRAPLMCMVSLRVTLEVPAAAALSVEAYKAIIAKYINKLSFEQKLTQAEIIGLLVNNGVRYIDTSSDATYGFKMTGQVRAANGKLLTLYGPDLVIDNIEDFANLIARNTCVFAIDPTNIFINLRVV